MKPEIYPLLMSALLILGPAHAELYKWTDENGQVHYGNVPPDSRAKTLDIEDCAAAECQRPDTRLTNDAPHVPYNEELTEGAVRRVQPDVVKRSITIPPNSRIQLRRWPYDNPMTVHRPPY